MLTLPAIILIALGLLASLVGGVWGIVVAFRRSLVWGLCYVFVPFAALVFLVVAWADAKRAFLLNTIGILLMASFLLLPNQGGLGLRKQMVFDLEHLAPFLPAVSGAVVPTSTADQLAELTAREQALRARKAALDPQDPAAAHALREEILRYNADLQAATGATIIPQSEGAKVVSNDPVPAE